MKKISLHFRFWWASWCSSDPDVSSHRVYVAGGWIDSWIIGFGSLYWCFLSLLHVMHVLYNCWTLRRQQPIPSHQGEAGEEWNKCPPDVQLSAKCPPYVHQLRQTPRNQTRPHLSAPAHQMSADLETPKTSRGQLADISWTTGGHLVDKWRTSRGQMADKCFPFGPVWSRERDRGFWEQALL